MTEPTSTPSVHPQFKKFARLRDSESDHLFILTRTNAHPIVIRDFCSRLILRHRGNPAAHMISPDLGWIVDVPQEMIQRAVREAVQSQPEQPQAEGASV